MELRPPRKTGSLDSDLFFAPPFSPQVTHHCVCFLIGPWNYTSESNLVRTFYQRELFRKIPLSSRLLPGTQGLFSNEPLFKEKLLERSIQRHAVSAIGCGAPQISFYCGFLRGPIVARGRGNLVSPIYNQGSFVGWPDTYSWKPMPTSGCPLCLLSIAAVESKPIPRAEPSHMPKRKKHDLGPWKALQMREKSKLAGS